MKIESVKPIPQATAPETSGGHDTRSGSPPRVAAIDPSSTPTGFAATSPTSTATPTGEVRASRSGPRPSSTPAFASANSGTTTKPTHGWRRYCRRSFGESAASTPRLASRARAAVGCSRNMRAASVARSSSSRPGGYAFTSRPIATPTSVGWIPDSSVASHTPAPTTA